MKKSLGLWIEEKLSHLILASLVLGFILGMSFPDASPYIAPVGDIFIRLMKMLILPLVFASIVDGVLSLKDTNDLSRMGSRTIGYYMGTTFLATLTGILVVNIIQPGVGFVESAATTQAPPEVKAFTFITFFENLIPINPFKVLAEGKVLPVIFFAISFALCILISREKSIVPKPDPLTAVFKRSFEAMMVMTKFVILLSPIGLFALIYKVGATLGISVLKTLMLYGLTVLAGLFLHALITLPLLLKIFGGRSPVELFKKVTSPILMAFSSASSSATLPLTMESLEKKADVSPQSTSFVLPLGATINMDGTALYEAVAALFIAQVSGIDLSIGQQLVVCLTASLVSVGAAGIPGAGLVMMGIVLNAVGLPMDKIALILAIDRFLDMFRTSINVWGDMIGACIIDNLVYRKGKAN